MWDCAQWSTVPTLQVAPEFQFLSHDTPAIAKSATNPTTPLQYLNFLQISQHCDNPKNCCRSTNNAAIPRTIACAKKQQYTQATQLQHPLHCPQILQTNCCCKSPTLLQHHQLMQTYRHGGNLATDDFSDAGYVASVHASGGAPSRRTKITKKLLALSP